ncbi:exportin-6-like [Paramacrobiotus metropolitanus]|uniref:exportin-6-like n=1 Tax=Paramacrobiotus metropolitanus TaxID=2943436 RepID=UPI0024458C56|nr:exportin-6-like [Paramacrobiotus metropolitanus]
MTSPAPTADEATLQLLHSAESLFAEYHQPATSNPRKAAIEIQLKQSLSDPRHWKLWIDSLCLSSSPYLLLHCLNLLNDLITHFWSTWTTPDQKQYIKDRLLHYLTDPTAPALPAFLHTKLLKLLVDVGRNDWPHFYPAFFQHVQMMVGEARLRLVGLKMLRLVCEEFVAPREDVRAERKEELHKLLLGKVPAVWGMLEKVLVPVAEGLSRGEKAAAGKEEVRCASEALQILNQLITWIPAGTAVPAALMQVLFFLANCDLQTGQLFELGAGGMACLVEMAGRVCASPDVEKNLWTIYEFAYVRLEAVNQQLEGLTELSDTASEYLQQFIELLRPLLTSHLQRFEAHAHFPTLNLLSRFFQFTFHLPAADLFLLCTDIWNDFLDRILAVSSARASSSRAAILQSYAAPILALVECLFKKVQLQYNQEFLESMQEDGEGEGREQEEYFGRCIGVMIKAGEIAPREVLERLVGRFRELNGMLAGVKNLIRTEANGSDTVVTLAISQDTDIQNLHVLLRDLSVVSQAAASHCGLLTGDLFPPYAATVLATLQSLLDSLQLLNHDLHALYHLRAPAPLPADLLHLHRALYSALEAGVPWIAQFSTAAPDLGGLLKTMLETTLEPVFRRADPRSAAAGAQMARALVKAIRTMNMVGLEPVERLYGVVVGGAIWEMEAEVRVNVLCVLHSVYTLPVVGVAEEGQGWEERVEKHRRVVQAVTERFCRVQQAGNAPPTPQVIAVVRETLGTLNAILLYCVDEPKKSKQILLQNITPVLHATAAMLPSISGVPEQRSAVLRFVLNVFTALKSAFPADLTPPLSDLFEGLFEQFLDPEELLRTLCTADPLQAEALSTCFDLLKLVVADPAYKAYLPFVIGLCHIVCPALERTPEIRIEFRQASYELLLSVLSQHWSYFFRSARLVEAGNGEGLEVAVMREEKVQTKDFLLIMHCLGAALLQPEISLTATVLRGLNQLHTARQVYDKSAFRELLRNDYLTALLRMLVQREKSLLAEDMAAAVWGMTHDSAAWWADVFLPAFLGQWAGLDERQREVLHGQWRRVEEQVGFTQQLMAFAMEMRCFLTYNSMTAQ